jgi:hypothetical protein
MTSQPKARLRRLNIRLSQVEYDKIASHSASTTCRSVSEYCRKILSGKPVRVFYRNKSFDDFEQRMIRLMPILEEYREKLDQLTKTLPTPDSIPEMRLYLTAIFSAERSFIKTMEEIKENLITIADQCAQK